MARARAGRGAADQRSAAPGEPSPAGVPADSAPGESSSRTEPVVVRRSTRRRRTVSAFREDGQVVVVIPARLSASEERRWVTEMLNRLAVVEQRRRPSDAALLHRAEQLSRRYLDGRATPRSVTWSPRQRGRWGSATPQDGSIRVSTRLRGMPAWVLDYVLVHELAHLIEPTHGPRFWDLVANFPRAERARGYLEGVAAAAELQDLHPEGPEDEAVDLEYDPAQPDREAGA